MSARPSTCSTIGKLHAVCNPDEADWVDLEGKLIWADGKVTFAFGKYEGITLHELAATEPRDVAGLLNGDFDPELRERLRRAGTSAPKPLRVLSQGALSRGADMKT